MAAPDHNVDALVQRLHTLGIELRLENEALRYRAPTGVFTPELKAAVQAAKSELIARLRASSHSTQVPPVIPRTDRRQPVRMSFGQERIWFLYRLEGPSSTYNVTPVFRLRGPLDQQAMASALAALVERHETLRMRFAEVDGIGVQIVDPPGPVTIDRIDLRPLPAAERMPAAESIILERTAQSFDLECGPVLKVGLVTLKDDDHILLPFMHHIVSDGWSLGVFHREFGLLYEALTQRKEPGLPPLPIQYPDYSAWVRSAHEGTAGQAGLTFWRQALQGAPQSLALPTDFPRPAIQRFQGRVLHRQIPLETTRALQELAQTQGCTLFMVLLAAYGVLLQRHCGQDDMLVGSPVANRPLRETEGLIGCFVNTVVLRLQLAGAGDFLALLQRVRQTTLDAYAHQDVPVESVIDTVIHRRDPSRMPLYQAQISLLNVPGAVAHLSELEVEPMRMERMAAKNDLCFILELGPEGIGFELEYNTDLFHEETADRLGADYLALLAAVTAAPHTPIGDLPVPSLPQAPPAAPAAAPPAEHTDLAAAFAATVAAHPNAIAVQDSREAISYATLDRQSDAIAARLQALGLAPETPVGLLCGRSTRLIAAMLGVLKAGAAYLPLAPEHPAERLRDCLRQSAAGALLCDPEHAALATSVAGSVPVHAIDADLLAASPATVLRPVADPGRLAYIIFTSGSTGRPKGVMIEHRAVLNLVAALRQRVHGELGEGLNIALMASPAFDASVQQIFPALLGGHRLCLIDAELRQDGAALCQRLADWRIDLSDCTPSLLAVMLDGGLADTASPRLRHLLVGGEPLPRDLLARLYAGAAGQHITVSNVYGPTECCVDVSCLRTQVGQLPEPAIVPIGQPLAGCRLLIVDEQNQVMPPGQVGELLIGGVCLGRGYVNDVQRTAERFVALPQLGLERAYRSGDLCRQGPDGVIEFLGRNDDQVKIRGYRIELGEIESRLRQHPDIAAACVLARSASSGQRELAAYLVCRGEPPSRRDIHDFLCQTLPDYMVPAWFVPLSTLPLNTSGKIERNALPNPEGASVLPSGVEHRAASSAAEEALAAVWQQTLRMERIGVHDNYFASGGDSIKALQVAARLREAGWALEIRDLFQHPTIAQLAPCLKRVPGGIPTTAAGPWVGDALLGAVQRFFFDTYGPARQFNQAVLLNCRVRVEAPALAAALEWLHQTHDVLRSCFVRTGDGWRQRFDASVQPTLRCHDLGRTSNAHEVLLEHCTEAQRAFALGQSPLFSADLFALPDGTQRLLLSAHHLIIDGVSWRILIDDLERLLQGASSLPPASTPYPAWVESQRAYAASADAEESAWWSSPLLAAPPRLPVDFSPEGPDRHRDRAELRAALNAPRTRDLLTGAHRRYSTEINDLLIAALVRAWCAWSGDRHCALSLEGHGREALAPGIDLSRSVGWFTSIFPVAFTLAPGDPGEQIKQVKDGLRAIPHKGASYAVLRHLAGVPGLPELPPLAFNYLGRFDGGSECFEPAPESPPSTVAPDTAWPWPLEITAAVITDRLEITLAYSRRRFAPTTAQRLLDGLAAELDRVIAHTLELREVALTVSDIAYGGFTQAQLDAFLATLAGPGEVENIYPLTPLQQGMYFHAQSDPDSSAYFEQWCLRVRGELRPDLVRAAWQTLVRRHETLRSIFTPGDGLRPLQAVLREQAVEITSVDFSRAPPQEAKARLQAARAADIARSFHLDTGPLTRLLLARLDDNHWEIVWSHHHIVLDGWSVAQLQREFLEIYAALRSGRTPELPPALAFHRFVRTLSEQSDLVFWQQYLQGHEEVASIPQGETLDATDSHSELRRHWCALSTRDTQRLDRLCRQTGCTVSVFLQAVWGVLLGRYCNREDVVFGYVFSGRTAPLPDIETAVGLFINTLPVRVRLRPGESFRQLLARLHGEVAELAARQQTPLADIQRACMHSGSLFDHVLALENYPVDEAMHHADPAATGFETVAVLSNDRTHYDFDLVVLPASDDLRFRFSYSPSVHDDAQVARLAGQLLHAVGALLDDPDQDPCRLNVLPPDQWQAVVEADPPLAAAPTKENTLFELFATQAAARPHAPAVLAPHGDDRWWSYGELAARASALGGQLRQAGVAPHDRIAVFLPPAEPAIAALLGVLHAGAAYVPVDPEYPPERVRFILEDACVAAVLTDHAHAALMPPLAVPVLEIDAPPVVPASPAMNAEPAAPVAPDATAYVIYTSGSTGTPKGCEISHRNVMRLLFQQRHEQRFDFSFGPGDTWVVAHSLSFDFSVWEIYGALLHGGRLLVPSREAVRDLPEFHALLARHRVSVLNQTPLAFYNLADYEASLETPGLGALRYVVFGGDRLEPARLHPWAAIHPLDRVALVNMYGITETTVHVSFCRLTPEHLAAPGPSPIGRPLAETMVYVVDHHLNPQPAGAPGELVVGGSGVGKGYLNRPELTAERFMPNPFHAGRLYRSGDLGWRTSDGRLFYLGRNDHQVKIRGHRIEPAEIEAALRTLPGVEQAVVLPENGAAGLELSAYVTGAAMQQPLREALAGRLPAHLMPTHLVHCEALPLTANGKLDRQALRKLREAAVHGDNSDGDRYQPPLGEQEQLLAEVWRGVLGVPRIGRHDRYLSLGGDSIKSIQVLARLRAAGWNLPLKDLFRHPTIAELAPRLVALQRTVSRNDTTDDGKPFSLTPIQLRFFAEWPHAERHHFNHAVLLRCTAGTTGEHLRQAVQILVDSHGALRLRFIRQAGGGWLQRVGTRGEAVAFDSISVEGTEALARHAEGAQRSLDIKHGPLLRALHYQLPNGTDRLLLIAHHLCIDGVSWRIVQQDMELLLRQLSLGQPVALPPTTDGFGRWSTLLRQARGDFLGQLPYWRQMDTAPAKLPSELQAPGRYGDLATAGFSLSEAATRELKQAGRAYQTHVGELLLAAFVRALHQWTELDTLQLALESHGRDVLEPSDLSRSVGWFTALYPLQLLLAYQSADRQIKEAKEALRRVPQAGLGYGVLRYLGEDDAGLCAQPPVCFNYLGEFDPPTDDALLVPCDGEIGAVVSPDGPRPFALELSASIVGGRFQCSLGFTADRVVPSRRLQLCQTLESELDTLVVHCLDKTAPELTPSDLTYKELSLDELDGIFDED